MVKVSWAQVCLPKAEGGLGLRRFADWNRTLCLRMIWLLFSTSGSLWVAWHRTHSLSRTTCFWNQHETANDSWNWRCLLRLRVLAKRFIKCQIGNGKTASFWFDNWAPVGPLIKYIGPDGPRSTRIGLNAKIADACTETGWLLAAPRSDAVLNLHIHLSTIPIPRLSQEPDSYDWVVEETVCHGFSAKRTWQILRPRKELVHWANVIWFKGATPRHAFTMWIANLDRLPTKTRLIRWGMNISPTCGLCNLLPETRDHLMLSCSFAKHLWTATNERLNLPNTSFASWTALMAWTRRKNDRSPPTLRKLVAQSVIYAIWKQRNNILHNDSCIPPSTVFKEIDR